MSARLHSSAAASHTANLNQPAELAQYLHDELMQLLAIALLHLDTARLTHTAPSDAALLQGRALVKEALDVTRNAVRSLCAEQPTLDIPLEQTLYKITEDVCRISQHPIQLHCNPLIFTPPNKVTNAVGQAARELLINACKHAPAATISAHLSPLSGEQNGFALTIQDNGPGFDPTHQTHYAGCGYGLTRIAQCLKEVGAELHVHSQQGEGLTALIEWVAPQAGRTAHLAADAMPSANLTGAL
jgi:signal transduction histidine kinase